MFLRIVFRALARHRGRRAAAVVAIGLGAGAAGCLLLLLVGVGDRVAAEMSAYRANLVIEPLAPGGTLDEAGLQGMRTSFWANQVQAAAPILELKGTPPVWGTDFGELKKLSKAWKVDGRWPQEPDEALAGESLSLPPGSKVRGFTITGVVSTGDKEDGVLLVDLHRAQAISGQKGRISSVLVSAVTTPESELLSQKFRRDPKSLKPADYERFVCTPFPTTVALSLADCFHAAQGRPIRPVTESEGTIVSKTKGVLLALAGAALVAAALGVLGSMAAVVVQRRRDVGLLKALGATDARVCALFLAEAAILGALGGLLGCVVAATAAHALSLSLFGWPVALSPVVLGGLVVLSILVSFAGALLPLGAAIRLQPQRVLHEV